LAFRTAGVCNCSIGSEVTVDVDALDKVTPLCNPAEYYQCLGKIAAAGGSIYLTGSS
jgi:hypothetical protein